MPIRQSEEGRRHPTVLILNENVSGMNRFLFREMEKELTLAVRDVPRPSPPRYLNAIRTFHPVVRKWKRRFAKAQTEFWVSPECFEERSAFAREAVRDASGYDVVFQIGAMFDGISEVRDTPCVGFASWNAQLSLREWPAWAPFRLEKHRKTFLDRERQYYARLSHLLCTNEYAMRSFVSDYGIPREKLTYIGYGANFDTLPDVEKTFTNNIALFVGYEFERKGGPTVVQAFRLVREEIPDARLRIVGPAFLDPEYLIEGVDHFPNISDRRLMQEQFREADFFVMPSICEPFGLVFLEAMAYKNACIGSRNNAMPEIIDHGRNGYLIEAGDVEGLARHMKDLFRNTELKRSMGLAARAAVDTEFNWEACGRRVLPVFRQLSAR